MSHFIGNAVDVRITGEGAVYATARSTATYHVASGNLRVGQAEISGGGYYYVTAPAPTVFLSKIRK